MWDLRYRPSELAAGVNHHQAVVVRVPGPLEERQRQDDVELARQRLEARNERVVVDRMRAREEPLALDLRPVVPLEELGQQDDSWRPCAAASRIERDRLRDVLLERVAHPHLDDRQRRLHAALHGRPTGCCCVTQWKAPPPVINARAGIGHDLAVREERPQNLERRVDRLGRP